MDTKITIVLAGVGGIGIRHLQALMNMPSGVRLYVVDINRGALMKAKSYYDLTARGRALTAVFLDDIGKVPPRIDLAIISTTSTPRRALTEKLLRAAKVRFILFEKVLFPASADYDAVGQLLSRYKVEAYVNCTRRMYSGYEALRKKLTGVSGLSVKVTGGSWGLGCNAIHMIDMIDYITDDIEGAHICAGDLLDNKLSSGKRTGFVEFTGTLAGSVGRTHYVLKSEADSAAPRSIRIVADNTLFEIDEPGQTITETDLLHDTLMSTEAFPIPYQSRLTHSAAEHILSGTTRLTSYARSCSLHKPMLREFIKKYNQINGGCSEICPIT